MADETPEVAPEAAPEPVEATPAPEVVPDPSTSLTSSDSSESASGDIADALVESLPSAQPVVVDNHTARDDNDARFNTFVDIVDGEHKGRVGHYFETVSHDLRSWYPEWVNVRTRDARNEVLSVLYKHIRPSRFTGGR